MSSPKPITITLARGYTDKEGAEHRDVTFGRRVTASDMFALDGDRQSEIPTQRTSLIVSRAITKFGALTMPVPLTVLLSLTKTDREELLETYDRFAIESAGERKAEFLSGHKVQLPFGFVIDDITYDIAEFGKEITGYDEVDADREGLTGLAHECFLIGREITRLSQSDGSATLDGPVLLSDFEALDGADVINLRIASQIWRGSFRSRRATVQRDSGAGSVNDSAGDKGMGREGHSESPND